MGNWKVETWEILLVERKVPSLVGLKGNQTVEYLVDTKVDRLVALMVEKKDRQMVGRLAMKLVGRLAFRMVGTLVALLVERKAMQKAELWDTLKAGKKEELSVELMVGTLAGKLVRK